MVKNPPARAKDVVPIPGSGRSPEGSGNPLQYSCLESSMDRGALGFKESDITEHLSICTNLHLYSVLEEQINFSLERN